MTRRRFIERNGGYYPTVTFEATYDNGATQIGVCHETQWTAYEAIEALRNAGAPEELIQKLYDAAYDCGRHDEFENNVD